MNALDVIAKGEALHEALGREHYLTAAGHKAEPAFQAIYERFGELQRDEVLAAARAAGPPAVVEWLVDLRVGRRVAPVDERQHRWEQQASVQVGARDLPYLTIPIELRNTSDRALRIAMDRARSAAVRDGLHPLLRERFELERQVLTELGWPDYVAGMAALSGIDLEALGEACGRLLDETADMYRDVLGRLVRRRIGVPVSDLVRADVGGAFRLPEADGLFPAGGLVATARRNMRELGLDVEQHGRIRFDTEDREGKQPRAFCVPVRVPEEVYLVLRPHGGVEDYRAFWHELGHALHFASVDPDRPFPERRLGDHSVTEAYAMLWDRLTVDPLWLARYTAAGAARRELVFDLAVQELALLRRYAAKLRYELVLHRSDLRDVGPVYAELLTGATLFRYGADDALLDVDPGFYAARYLRAWQLSGLLAETFRERFDEDWFRNPRAGAHVQHLMSRGQATPAEPLAAEATGRALTFGPVTRRLEALLS